MQRYGYGGFIQLAHPPHGRARMMKDGQLFREIDDNCWSPEARLQEMDATGECVCLSVCLSVCLPACLPVCLSVHPSVRPSIRPSICLSVVVSMCVYV